MTYLNLIGQTNASIESVPGTSQPQRNITCATRLDINYIMSRYNVRLFRMLRNNADVHDAHITSLGYPWNLTGDSSR